MHLIHPVQMETELIRIDSFITLSSLYITVHQIVSYVLLCGVMYTIFYTILLHIFYILWYPLLWAIFGISYARIYFLSVYPTVNVVHERTTEGEWELFFFSTVYWCAAYSLTQHFPPTTIFHCYSSFLSHASTNLSLPLTLHLLFPSFILCRTTLIPCTYYIFSGGTKWQLTDTTIIGKSKIL